MPSGKPRLPCPHGDYDDHQIAADLTVPRCPGGEFLPDDVVIMRRVKGAWYEGNRLSNLAQSILHLLIIQDSE